MLYHRDHLRELSVLIPGIITGVALIVVSRFMERRTQKGADVYARCKGLRKWLQEFSALDERPATDVKVWANSWCTPICSV